MSTTTFFLIAAVVAIIITVISITVHLYQKSRGKISVVPDKYNYAPGEKVTGKVIVELKKPIPASKLTVSLIAERKVMTPNTARNSNNASINVGGASVGNSNARESTQIIYSFELPLDGDKTYQQGEYPFEIDIPQDVLGLRGGVSSQPQGTAEKLIKVVAEFNAATGGAITGTRIDWNLHAQLYVPGKLDIRGKTQINVG